MGRGRAGLTWDGDPRVKPPFGAARLSHKYPHLIRSWLMNETGGGIGDLVVANRGSLFGTTVWAPTTEGRVPSFDGATGTYIGVDGGGGLDGYPGTKPLTIAMRARWRGTQPLTNGIAGVVLARQKNGVFSNNLLGLSSTDPAVGPVRLQWSAVGGNTLTGATSVGSGRWRDIVITKDASGNFTLFLDGVSDGTGVDAATLGSDPAIPLTLGAWIGDGLQYSVSDISFLHLLAIQFSAEDAFRFHVTPYAMLEPVVRRRYFVPAAAGGVTYPQLERGIRGLERGVAIGSFR